MKTLKHIYHKLRVYKIMYELPDFFNNIFFFHFSIASLWDVKALIMYVDCPCLS